ncbi:MAG TPA: HEAT repeat domain-containing protein [Candidatus Polarisedimenticolaceae bacterium]|nr:HEAT repeat domain-containing protein [Candidatus Polarisedimenticolaceae bacterium]
MAAAQRCSRGIALALVTLWALSSARAVTEPPPEPAKLGLYEWMAVAPIVVAASVVSDDAKYIQAVTQTPVKGGVKPSEVVLVDLRTANRDRELGTRSLDLERGRAYLLLLKPSSRGKNEAHPVFDLVRGTRGAKPLPPEGAEATIAAAVQLADLQERKDDELLWAKLADFIEDTNPVLVDAALDLFVKFHRESAEMIPVVEPLLDHPSTEFRRRAVLLIGRILARPSGEAIPERAMIVAELTGRARRDGDVAVRREATVALAALGDGGVDETLRTISRDDPDQNVRFEAEKALFERSERAGARSD